MTQLSDYIIMSALEADYFRDATSGDADILMPIEIIGGPYLGQYALPAAVKTDPAFRTHWDEFAKCDEVSLDIETAFPQSDVRGV